MVAGGRRIPGEAPEGVRPQWQGGAREDGARRHHRGETRQQGGAMEDGGR